MKLSVPLWQASSTSLNRCFTPFDFWQSLQDLSTGVQSPVIATLSNTGRILKQEAEQSQWVSFSDLCEADNRWRKRLLHHSAPVARISDFPLCELRDSSLYRCWLKPHGWLYGAVVAASDQHKLLAWVIFLHAETEGDFTDEAIEYLSQWQPSFTAAARRVLLIQERLGRASLINTIADYYHLSEREKDVLQAILEGKSDEQIADSLSITPGTVKNHIEHIREKTATHHRIDLALLILRELPE